jgi:hypothetical protein
MNLCHPETHAYKIGQERTLAENGRKTFYEVYQPGGKPPTSVREDFVIASDGEVVPRPRVGKSLRLGAVLFANVVIDLVVIPLRVEWWVNVTEINRAIRDLAGVPEDIKVVSVI